MRVPWYLRKVLPSIALIRVSFFLTCVALGFALLAARAAKADIGELGMAAGRQLDHLQDLTVDAETLLINGARLSRATRYTPDAVSNVLDRVEDACVRNPGMLGQALREVPDDAKAKQVYDSLPQAGQDGSFLNPIDNVTLSKPVSVLSKNKGFRGNVASISHASCNDEVRNGDFDEVVDKITSVF